MPTRHNKRTKVKLESLYLWSEQTAPKYAVALLCGKKLATTSELNKGKERRHVDCNKQPPQSHCWPAGIMHRGRIVEIVTAVHGMFSICDA